MSSLSVPAWAWAMLAVIVVTSIAIDLLAHRGDRVDSKSRALGWTLVWVGLALAFGAWITVRFGARAGEEYLAAYLLEKSLSLDNLFVFLLVFSALKIPPHEQRRVLTWGILGAIVMRGLLIFAGAAAIGRWHALTYVFGGILLLAAIKLLLPQAEEKESRIVLWLQRHVKWSKFAIAIVAIELTDVVFAIDSVPAAFAVTQDEFIIYSSNLFAILGLRALYIVLAGALGGLRYLKFGLAAVLGFAGGKLVLAGWVTMSPLGSVAVIAGCLGVSVVASIVANRRDPRIPQSPLQDAQSPHAGPLE
jgi:tellurite resistance protein TerC